MAKWDESCSRNAASHKRPYRIGWLLSLCAYTVLIKALIIAALFTIDKRWHQPRYPSKDE